MADTRNTVQKSIIMETIRQTGGHQAAESVYKAVHETYPSISRATVYRNLNQLALQGTLKKVQVPEGADVFDLYTEPHYHIRCSVCGRVYDVDLPYMEDLNSRISNYHGFQIQSHDIVFNGICPNCVVSTNSKEA